jgi:hypothetical protein
MKASHGQGFAPSGDLPVSYREKQILLSPGLTTAQSRENQSARWAGS